MEKRFIPLATTQKVGMSAAVRFGGLIAVSGQVALNAKGELVGKGDIATQVAQCFANIADVLGQAGASLSDVVSVTTYLKSPDLAPAFLEARARAFPEHPPATTTVIAQMLSPDFLVEIQALAAVD
jgi:enamine deaminase RidA (YjgF/YER057c/UK114 family)